MQQFQKSISEHIFFILNENVSLLQQGIWRSAASSSIRVRNGTPEANAYGL